MNNTSFLFEALKLNLQVERIARVVGDLDVEGPGSGGAAVVERHRTCPGAPRVQEDVLPYERRIGNLASL